jgi:hypothetical protein
MGSNKGLVTTRESKEASLLYQLHLIVDSKMTTGYQIRHCNGGYCY